MYHFWRQHPLFRPALGLICGILLTEYGLERTGMLLSLLAWLLIFLLKLRLRALYRVRLLPFLVFVWIGVMLHGSRQPAPPSPVESGYYLAEVQDGGKASASGISFTLSLLSRGDSGQHSALRPLRVRTFFYRDSTAALLLPGDRILVYCRPDSLRPPLNPHTFDYRTYLLRQGIEAQAFVSPGNWMRLEVPPGRFAFIRLLRLAHRLRMWAIHVIRCHIPDPGRCAVLEALVCGYTDDLDPETRSGYALSGTLHVLAVSGMHVAILLMICMKLMVVVRVLILRNLLLIALLWFYALITGLSPSVLRAVCMGSFYLTGEMLNRKHSTWNALAFALIALLSYDSHLLFNPGFQLSFLALSGILLFNQGTPDKSRSLKEKGLRYLLDFTRISLAAQLATSPLSMYYFKQFPTWFLPGNFLIVPLSAPMMYGGLALLLFSGIPWLATAIAWVTDRLLWLCQSMAAFVSGLPGAALDPGKVDAVWALSAYGLIGCGLWYFLAKKKSALWVAAALIGLMLTRSLIQYYQSVNQSGIVIYAVKNAEPIDLMNGRQVHGLGDAWTVREEAFVRAPLLRSRSLTQADGSRWIRYPWGASFETEAQRLLRIDGSGELELPESSKPVYLLPSPESRIRLCIPPNSLQFCNIVLSGKHHWKSRNYWEREAARLQVRLIDVMETGALILE